MKVKPTAAQVKANPDWMPAMIAKLFSTFEWKDSEYGRGWLQEILDSDVEAEGIRAYSPVLSQAQVQESVPVSWPNSKITPVISEEVIVPPEYDEETGELLQEGYTVPAEYGPERQKVWEEYTQAIEVTGGYVLRFTGVAADANMNVKNVDSAAFKVWKNKFGGFLTEAEVNEIKIIGEI